VSGRDANHRCGSFGCDLPAGHNRGRADIPANHRVSGRDANQLTEARSVLRAHEQDRRIIGDPLPCWCAHCQKARIVLREADRA